VIQGKCTKPEDELYQRGNRNPYTEEEQTTQWPNEKVQKDKQRSTKKWKTKYHIVGTVPKSNRFIF
jgi:hypothetical protein